MGASLSPLLKNIFMVSIETFAIHNFRLPPCFWGRFMDDVVCIWNQGLDSLDLSHKHLITLCFIALPYIPILREMLRRILRKHNNDTCFQSVRSIGSLRSSGKHLTRGNLVSRMFKILYSCGKFYIGTTHQQFIERFLSIATQ